MLYGIELLVFLSYFSLQGLAIEICHITQETV